MKHEDCVIHYYNHSAIHLAKTSVFHSRNKHVYMRHYFIKELISNGALFLQIIIGITNRTYMFTKMMIT